MTALLLLVSYLVGIFAQVWVFYHLLMIATSADNSVVIRESQTWIYRTEIAVVITVLIISALSIKRLYKRLQKLPGGLPPT